MRPLSEQQLRLLACPTGYTVRGRVRVQGPGGTWYDLTNLFGRAFLEGVDVDESLDSPAGQATVRVTREVHGLSLAPLVTDSLTNNLGGSYSPLLDENRFFRVEVGLAPTGMEPGTADWLPLFYGRIDDIDSAGDVITFRGRDLVGVLQDVWVPAEAVYGSDAGTPLQTVCQSILNDSQLSSLGLYTPVDPTQNLGKYKQDVQPVWDALMRLATGRGWEVRQKFRTDTGDWGLFLWGPDRTATSPVWTYTASDYEHLGELSTSLADVRTAVTVTYPDASDPDAAGQPKRKTVRREDTAATARYGYPLPGGTAIAREMRIAEAATSNTRSLTEATRLADSGLADLSTVSLGASVEVLLHPGLELGDLVQLDPNGFNFNAPQILAVRQVTHTLTATDWKTRLSLRGKPSLSPLTWLRMETRMGAAPAVPFTGPSAPSGLTVTKGVAGAVLVFTAPNVTSGGPAADSYELHLGTTSGFTLSNATLKAVGSSTRFDITGLVAGTTYYARVVSRDTNGNRGPASSEVTLSPRYVAPMDAQPQVAWGSLPPNADFEANTVPGAPPDTWRVTVGAWGTGVTTTTDSYSGGTALRFVAGQSTDVQSQLMSIRSGELYVLDVLAKLASTATPHAFIGIRFFATIGGGVVGGSSRALAVTGSTWAHTTVVCPAPATARYAAVFSSADSTSTVDTYVDSADFARCSLAQEDWVLIYSPAGSESGVIPYEHGWTTYGGGYGQVGFRRNSLGNLEFKGMAKCPTPVPATGATVFTLPPGYWPVETKLVRLNFPVTGDSDLQVFTDGRVTLQSATAGQYLPFDGISIPLK